MTQTQKQLDWYRKHPYVKVWRSLDQNSIQATRDEINKTWNVGNRPRTYNSVSDIISTYLSLLLKHIKASSKTDLMVRRGTKYFEEKFKLNKTEALHVVNHLYNKIQRKKVS